MLLGRKSAPRQKSERDLLRLATRGTYRRGCCRQFLPTGNNVAVCRGCLSSMKPLREGLESFHTLRRKKWTHLEGCCSIALLDVGGHRCQCHSRKTDLAGWEILFTRL
ncbi:hypothetical protein AVEN_122662-1 [Araneus ventricosus]|uniref:Uncharacterized protein n=1 Tax=Araneus ventricosus TaxID=182803 RepID=A0A4Y2FJ50_ARAVE|nr:hypothetical protein AVEN_122662-1 [Araneus ventricosus]